VWVGVRCLAPSAWHPAAPSAGALAPCVDEWFLAGLEGPRGLSPESLWQRLTGVLDAARTQALPDVPAALDAALQSAGPSDRILVFGSFHTVEEAGAYLESPGVAQHQ